MQLFTRKTAAILFSNMRLQRWCFDVELIYIAQRLSIPVAEVPVTWTEIPGMAGLLGGCWQNGAGGGILSGIAGAGSKIRVTSMLHMAWELLSILSGYTVFRLWAVRTPAETL